MARACHGDCWIVLDRLGVRGSLRRLWGVVGAMGNLLGSDEYRPRWRELPCRPGDLWIVLIVARGR